MADPRWWMEFSKITVELVQNPHPRIFGVAESKFIGGFINKIQYGGSKMADEILKNHGRINTKSPPTDFWGRRI